MAAALAVCTSFIGVSVVLAQSPNADKPPVGAAPKYDPAIYAELQKAPEKARKRANPLQNDLDAVAAGSVVRRECCRQQRRPGRFVVDLHASAPFREPSAIPRRWPDRIWALRRREVCRNSGSAQGQQTSQ